MLSERAPHRIHTLPKRPHLVRRSVVNAVENRRIVYRAIRDVRLSHIDVINGHVGCGKKIENRLNQREYDMASRNNSVRLLRVGKKQIVAITLWLSKMCDAYRFKVQIMNVVERFL